MIKIEKIAFVLIVALFVISCSKKKNTEDKTEKPVSGTTVKVMTYNIYGARASSGPPADLQALADVIKVQDPDIIALQEVDVFTNRTGKNVHQARDLAALLGMEWYFVKAIDRDGGEYGDAVLSKLPIKEKKDFHLNVAPGVSGELRSVALIKVAKDGKEFNFASTHLDHLAIEDNRILQANELKTIVKGINGPLILAGDFNATPESQTISIMREFMNPGCRQQCPFTYPSDSPARTIDYVMYAPVNSFTIQSYNAVPYRPASDHAPVVADVQIK